MLINGAGGNLSFLLILWAILDRPPVADVDGSDGKTLLGKTHC
jgi:hypothetical protein